MSASAAHSSDDGALGSAGDMWLVARFTDSLDDVLNLCFSGAIRHVDNHCVIPLLAETISKDKGRDFENRGLDWNLDF